VLRKRKNDKGQVTFVFIFLFVAVIILVVTALVAPMMVRFNSVMYAAGDDILAASQDDITGISDPVIRAQINDSINEARDASQTNINVGTDLYQYSWIFMLVLVAIIMYLFSRQTIEYGSGGGLI
jgi:predicted PurR-regulated permease PerM